jgi:Ca-activated chloride channel family protein
MACPAEGGGYFLLLAGVPAKLPKGPGAIKREVTIVLDRSGSMNGGKIAQAREAALEVLSGLDEGEAFNLIVYNQNVYPFSSGPVVKTKQALADARKWLDGVNALGSTNLHDALVEALRPKPTDGMLPIVLFITDGLPTTGNTSEVAIRDAATKANPFHRRVFTFGVGLDVNTPLLDAVAADTRATSTYVLPKEDVEVKVAQVFAKLSGPVLASPELGVLDAAATPAHARVRDLLPAKLPDLYEGDQLVLLGRYTGEEPLTFVLSGNYLGKARTFRFTFGLDRTTTRNAFVSRLWASRQIATLADAIRRLGADGPAAAAAAASRDSRVKELVGEIVRLSTEFGILTEYTSFLAREGTNLTKRDEVIAEATRNFTDRAMNTRSGTASYNQSANLTTQMAQQEMNSQNRYYDQNMNRVAVTSIQQVTDRAFYLRGGRWVDSRIVGDEARMKPERVVEFGSDEFREIVRKLTAEGRAATISLRGDILIVIDGQTVLIKGAAARGAE